MQKSTAIVTAGLLLASGATAAPKMLPQEFKGAKGRYEMCVKRHVLDLRKVRGKAMEPLDELASAQVSCRPQAPKDGSGGDVIASIMECGVAYGDGVEEQGCPQ